MLKRALTLLLVLAVLVIGVLALREIFSDGPSPASVAAAVTASSEPATTPRPPQGSPAPDESPLERVDPAPGPAATGLAGSPPNTAIPERRPSPDETRAAEQQRHENSVVEDRSFAQMQAMVRKGQQEAARQEATSFYRRFPKSAYLERVQSLTGLRQAPSMRGPQQRDIGPRRPIPGDRR